MNIKITPLSEIKKEELSKTKKEVENIFFTSSSRQSFDSKMDKQLFAEHWLQYYFENSPDLFYLAQVDGKTIAYLSGCLDSTKAKEALTRVNPAYSTFEDLFAKFPAHLHINALEQSRGLGVGHQLVEHFCSRLQKEKIPGLHIVTTKDSRNVSFYKKNNFLFSEERTYSNSSLLFMGKTISL